MFLNNVWVINKIKRQNQNYLEKNENENTATQNLQDTAKQASKI